MASQHSSSLNRLDQHVAIVTGAGTGIGAAVALAFADAGAAVVVNDLNPDKVEQIADLIKAQGGRSLAWHADVANRFQVSSMIEKVRDTFGKVTTLVNAAGVYKTGGMSALDEWDWRRVLDVNMTGAFFCTQLLSRVMIDEKINGVILNISAPVGGAGSLAEDIGGISYVSSKAGLLGLTRQSARELAPHGIRVNALCPANIEGDDSPLASADTLPLRRHGTAEEVAAVAVFLASDAASFITGQVINVDGGGSL